MFDICDFQAIYISASLCRILEGIYMSCRFARSLANFKVSFERVYRGAHYNAHHLYHQDQSLAWYPF